jgi:hypothetical protein
MAISPGGRPADASSRNLSPRQNWVDKAGGFGSYTHMIVNALERKGVPRSRRYAIAKAALQRMAAGIGPSGKGKVRPQVQAAAARELARWAEMEARARAS